MAHPLQSFSNPMTTRGDLIVENSALVPTRLAIGANTYVLTSNGTDPSWQPAGGASALSAPIFGDGSDGVINFDGTNTYAGIETHTGSAPNFVYTLARDVLATTFTVAAGITVKTAGCAIYATTSATINGTLHNNGNNASGRIGGVSGASGNNGAFSGSNPSRGGDGGSAAVGESGFGDVNVGAGGSGGGGGAAAVNAGGAGGANTYFPFSGTFRTVQFAMNGASAGNGPNGPFLVQLGGTGGGGGADAASTGGGGGSAAGALSVIALAIVVGAAGTISVKGGNAANGAGASAGGGGGGGGGVAWLVCQTHVNNGTESAAGGTAGSGAGTGSAGVAGSAGVFVLLTGH